jgi:diguanylate cyclase (GGDEF)-like protein
MKNKPEGENLRRSVSRRGRTLAVLSLSSGDAFEADPGIDLVRGEWDGKPAVAIVASPDPLSQRGSHENDLKSLHEISFELSLCQGVDDVCRDAVRLGRERLGFDRLGVWLVDQNDPNWKIGTWGTDESGKLRDERGWRIQRAKGDVPDSFYEGRVPLIFDENTVCRGSDGIAVGRGNKLVAPLWDGHMLLGELGVDDLLGHGGFSPEKREVFVIFSRVVAHLISLKRAEAELKQLASTDSLTGTVNRRTALIILEKHLGQCRRSGSPLTLCLADLDGLKIVNDAFGHAAGDEYICKASAALVGAVRGSDTVGRIGGDEFLIVFPDCHGDVVAGILERVNAEMAAGAKDRGYVPRLSWGIASPVELAKGSWSDNADLQRCIDMLLELADQRMYDNKRTKGAPRLPASGEAKLAL